MFLLFLRKIACSFDNALPPGQILCRVVFLFFIHNLLCNHEEDFADFLFQLFAILIDELGRCALRFQEAEDCLAIAHVFSLHGAPDDQALAKCITRYKLLELTALDQDSILLYDQVLGLSANKIPLLIDLGERQEAAQENSQLLHAQPLEQILRVLD